MFDTEKIFDWELDPWIPTDMMTVGLVEQQIIEEKVIDMIDYIRSNYGYYISSEIIDTQLQERDIDYAGLPQYLKNKIDDAFECH